MGNDLNDSQVEKVFKESQARSIKEFEKFEEQRKNAMHEIEKLLEMASSNKKGPSEKQKIFLVHLQDHLNKSLDTSLANIKRLTPSDESLEDLKSIQAEVSNTLAITTAALSFMGPVIRGVNLAVDARNLMGKVFEKLPLMKNIVDKYNPIAAGLADEKIAKIQKIDAILNQENYKESMDKINKISFHSSTPDLEKPLKLEEILPAEDRSLYYINGADEPAQLLQNNQDEFFDLLTHLANSDDKTLLLREAALVVSDWRKAIKIANISTDFFNNFQNVGDEVLIPTAKNNATADIAIMESAQESTHDFFKSLDKTLEEDYTDLSKKLMEKVERIKIESEEIEEVGQNVDTLFNENNYPKPELKKDTSNQKPIFDYSSVTLQYIEDFSKEANAFFKKETPKLDIEINYNYVGVKSPLEDAQKLETILNRVRRDASLCIYELSKVDKYLTEINQTVTVVKNAFDIVNDLNSYLKNNIEILNLYPGEAKWILKEYRDLQYYVRNAPLNIDKNLNNLKSELLQSESSGLKIRIQTPYILLLDEIRYARHQLGDQIRKFKRMETEPEPVAKAEEQIPLAIEVCNSIIEKLESNILEGLKNKELSPDEREEFKRDLKYIKKYMEDDFQQVYSTASSNKLYIELLSELQATSNDVIQPLIKKIVSSNNKREQKAFMEECRDAVKNLESPDFLKKIDMLSPFHRKCIVFYLNAEYKKIDAVHKSYLTMNYIVKKIDDSFKGLLKTIESLIKKANPKDSLAKKADLDRQKGIHTFFGKADKKEEIEPDKQIEENQKSISNKN